MVHEKPASAGIGTQTVTDCSSVFIANADLERKDPEGCVEPLRTTLQVRLLHG